MVEQQAIIQPQSNSAFIGIDEPTEKTVARTLVKLHGSNLNLARMNEINGVRAPSEGEMSDVSLEMESSASTPSNSNSGR